MCVRNIGYTDANGVSNIRCVVKININDMSFFIYGRNFDYIDTKGIWIDDTSESRIFYLY